MMVFAVFRLVFVVALMFVLFVKIPHTIRSRSDLSSDRKNVFRERGRRITCLLSRTACALSVIHDVVDFSVLGSLRQAIN